MGRMQRKGHGLGMTRVEKLIKKLENEFGRNFNHLRDNLWSVNIFLDGNNRHQMVYLKIREKKEGSNDLSRFVCTSAICPAEGLDLEQILRKNLALDVGTFAIEDAKYRDGLEVTYLIFKASHLAATADYAEIWELITKTATYADKLEKELFSDDRH